MIFYEVKNEHVLFLCRQVSLHNINVVDRDQTRAVLVHLSSEADQDRTIDALSALDPSAAGEDSPEVAERLVVAGQSAIVSVITPLAVADALRTISFK